MADSNSYRRRPFPHRPWITGQLWDKYSAKTVLHCDAYTFAVGEARYLYIDWREGGRKQVALDCYLIEVDGLTPVWDAGRVWASGVPVYWHSGNSAVMARLHKRVLAQRATMLDLGQGRWTQVATLCHYVLIRQNDPEIRDNAYVERKTYKTGITANTLPDIL